MALIFRLRRYMGVLARTVVTSNVSRWYMTSGIASRPSWTVNVYSWWTVPRKCAAFRAANRSGEFSRPMENECSWGQDVMVAASDVRWPSPRTWIYRE